MPFRPRHILLLLPLALGCPAHPPPCDVGVLGDGNAPMQVELIEIAADSQIRALGDCAGLDIIKPPQGGRVAFVGIRATNLDGCGVTLDAALRDPASRGILGAERRRVVLSPIPDRPGWGQTGAQGGDFSDVGFSDFANIALCPNTTERDVQRLPSVIEVNVTDAEGRTGAALARVVARCTQTDPGLLAECECMCEAGYTTSKCATWDAGAFPDAGTCASSDGGGGGDGT